MDSLRCLDERKERLSVHRSHDLLEYLRWKSRNDRIAGNVVGKFLVTETCSNWNDRSAAKMSGATNLCQKGGTHGGVEIGKCNDEDEERSDQEGGKCDEGDENGICDDVNSLATMKIASVLMGRQPRRRS
jgi:hypothetical protein